MNRLARVLILFVVAFHLTAFVVEAFLWMRPAVHERVLVGAGLVLAMSTGAYIGAFLQAVPPAVALVAMWRVRNVAMSVGR
jgi:hypothetical protein